MSVLSFVRPSVAVLAVALMTGCAIQAPRYQPALDNADALKKAAPAKVGLGSFAVKPGATGAASISLRGNPMSSPIGADYAAYLADALQQELTLAGLFDPQSAVQVSGTLLHNDIAAGGFSTNSGEIQAQFVVRRGGNVTYDATLKADASWDSSFVGAVAIPKAQASYPTLVQRLLAKLFGDAAFIAALR